MFLHGGWVHLVGNLIFLWVFGTNIEDHLCRFRFVVFYLAAGAVARGAYLIWFPWARVRTFILLGVVAIAARTDPAFRKRLSIHRSQTRLNAS
jgi:membrane associated rhomboid family serine protease